MRRSSASEREAETRAQQRATAGPSCTRRSWKWEGGDGDPGRRKEARGEASASGSAAVRVKATRISLPLGRLRHDLNKKPEKTNRRRGRTRELDDRYRSPLFSQSRERAPPWISAPVVFETDTSSCVLAFAWTASASARGQDRGRCPFSTRHSALNPSSPLSPYSVSTTKRERGRSISVVSSIHHLAPSSLKHGTWDQLRRPASRSKRRKLRRTRQSTEGARRGSCSLAWPRTACSLPRRGATGRRAAGMDYRDKVLVGVAAGIAAAALAAACVLLAIWLYRRRASVAAPTRSLESPSTTLRADGAHCASLDSSVSVSVVSECVADWGHPPPAKRAAFWAWRGGAGHNGREPSPLTVSGIPKYHYKDLQKATSNFTTILGQGSFGPVYKAVMATGEVVAVKVLASDSRQGEREFQTEVALLSRLHHRNLVNLVGYCVEKGQRILIYEYMSNGSLARLLYGDNKRSLSWQERLQIAHDISHGIEYLHEGAVPPVIHRDLKSDNILLDHSMRAKVADFGLSKEEVYDGRKSGLKGTYGYMDPDYMSTNKLTKKSDVYSFGIILFELITAINPQQGLMDYINLAAIGGEGRVDWDEILDKDLLVGNIPEEVRMLADVAYRCVNKSPRKRPWISEVTQAISRLRQRQLTKHDALILPRSETRTVLRRIEYQHVELSDLTSMKELTPIGA